MILSVAVFMLFQVLLTSAYFSTKLTRKETNVSGRNLSRCCANFFYLNLSFHHAAAVYFPQVCVSPDDMPQHLHILRARFRTEWAPEHRLGHGAIRVDSSVDVFHNKVKLSRCIAVVTSVQLAFADDLGEMICFIVTVLLTILNHW